MAKVDILIADAGSTKTHWVLIGAEGEHVEFKGMGINPTVHRENEVKVALESALDQIPSDLRPEHIFFYGAGCSSDEDRNIIRKAFESSRLSGVTVKVEHDLLGAARALFGRENGIACILGTGSSSGLYNNGKITDKLVSLGYVLGDDGGGVDLGKRLIRSTVNRQLPPRLRQAFYREFDISDEEIVHHIYKEPYPNRFIASFVPFLSDHLDDKFCKALIIESFQAFLDNAVRPYGKQDATLGFLGSVAFHFKSVLKEVCEKNDLSLGQLMKDPMAGLIEYHRT